MKDTSKTIIDINGDRFLVSGNRLKKIELSPFDFMLKNFGKKIKEARLKNNKMTLDNLSQLTNLTKSLLSLIENAKVYPSVNTLYKIAGALNISFEIKAGE